MIDEKTKVVVESIGVGSVGYQPDHNPLIKRRWDRPGIKKSVPFGEIQEVMSSTGGEILFTYHLLIKDPEVRAELDLPMEEQYLYSDADLEVLIKGPLPKLKEILPTLPKESQQRLAEKAATIGIESVPKITAIKEVTGLDVYKMVEQINESKQPNKS